MFELVECIVGDIYVHKGIENKGFEYLDIFTNTHT